MLTLNFNPFPQINTPRLCLRQISPNDVNEVFFLRSDEVVMKYIDRPKAKTKEDALKWIDLILDLENNHESINWVISVPDTLQMIGNICFWRIAKEHYRAEVGYTLHPDYHGKGIMQEALSAVLHYGFTNMQLHSVEAKINPLNIPSQKLLEKNKFVKEAYFREDYFFEGKFYDTAIYCVLSSAFVQNDK